MTEAWIIDGARSPRGKGKPNGALHHLHPQNILGQVLNGLVAKAGVDPAVIDDVVIGNGESAFDHGSDIARLAVLQAGWPESVPGVTLNRFCGGGQQAAAFAAMGVRSGEQNVVVAGGVESMSRYGELEATMVGRNADLIARYPVGPQGISADVIANLEGFRRSDVDEFAVRSQDNAAAAIADGRFDRTMIAILNADGSVALDHEEFPRPGTTVETMAGLKPAFAALADYHMEGYPASFGEIFRQRYGLDHIDHVHHAGNSSGVVDGAAALLVASSDWATANGVKPRARIRATAVAGTDPVLMLTAPTPAAEKVLANAGMSAADIDLWEINEAFAAIPMKTMRDLKVDPDLVNVNGGSIALGHPIGATGVVLIQTVLDELERRDLTAGLVVACTGGGMGTATIIERI